MLKILPKLFASIVNPLPLIVMFLEIIVPFLKLFASSSVILTLELSDISLVTSIAFCKSVKVSIAQTKAAFLTDVLLAL